MKDDFIEYHMWMNMDQQYIMWKSLKVIADTFSRLSHKDDDVSSAFVGKEATANVSDSNVTQNISLFDDKDMLECFLALKHLDIQNNRRKLSILILQR